MLTTFFIFNNILLGGMVMAFNKAYWMTYNRFLWMETNKLLDIVFIGNNNFLENIALRVLLDDYRLLKVNDYNVISLIIKKLSIEDLWDLAKLNFDSLIVNLAKEKVNSIIDETFYKKEKTLYLVK